MARFLPFIPVKFDLMVVSAKYFLMINLFRQYVALKVKPKNSMNREIAVSKLTGNERLIVFSFWA